MKLLQTNYIAFSNRVSLDGFKKWKKAPSSYVFLQRAISTRFFHFKEQKQDWKFTHILFVAEFFTTYYK